MSADNQNYLNMLVKYLPAVVELNSGLAVSAMLHTGSKYIKVRFKICFWLMPCKTSIYQVLKTGKIQIKSQLPGSACKYMLLSGSACKYMLLSGSACKYMLITEIHSACCEA